VHNNKETANMNNNTDNNTVEMDDCFKQMPHALFEAYHGGMEVVMGQPKMRPDAPRETVPCSHGCGKQLRYMPGYDEWRGYDPKDFACVPCAINA